MPPVTDGRSQSETIATKVGDKESDNKRRSKVNSVVDLKSLSISSAGQQFISMIYVLCPSVNHSLCVVCMVKTTNRIVWCLLKMTFLTTTNYTAAYTAHRTQTHNRKCNSTEWQQLIVAQRFILVGFLFIHFVDSFLIKNKTVQKQFVSNTQEFVIKCEIGHKNQECNSNIRL